jgi:hypothetical protein
MIEQFKLRLRDGTILAVDHDGLRTWLLDDKAMVQPAGSRVWRPLRETLTLLERERDRERVAAAARRPEPERVEPTPSRPPSTVLPLVPPPPRVAAEPPPRAAEPAPRVVAEPEEPHVVEPAAWVAAEPAPPAPADPRPVPVVAAAPRVEILTTIADSVAPDRTSAAPAARATAPVVSTPVVAPPPVASLPVIPFKPVEDEDEDEAFYVPEAPARVAVDERREGYARAASESVSLLDVASAEVDRHSGEESPWQWTPSPAREAPDAVRPAPIAFKQDMDEEFEDLPELELVEDVPPAPVSAPAALGEMFSWTRPLASSWRDRAFAMARRPSVRRGMLVTGAVAAGLVAIVAVATVLPGAGASASRAAAPAAPIQAPAKAAPEVLPAVQAVVDEAPHLAPETVQLLLATNPSYGVPDAPEIFRRAYAAAERGASSLTADEASELRGLTKSVLAVLGPSDRKRVLAYSRLSTGRNLLASEDRRVLSLFARGVRTLPTTHRERLQALTAKAVAAAIPPPAPAR